jgi:branched-chain amino acid transport system ATP-binding protein
MSGTEQPSDLRETEIRGAPLISVRDLHVSYGPVLAVQGISFEVAAGQIAAMIGANGAGKTTTLGALSGLIPASRGQVLLRGAEVTGCSTAELLDRGVVLVPEGRAILGRMSVLENLALLALGGYRRSDRAVLRADVERMLERFPILGQRRHQLAGSLSGGEQQQLAIARGLLARPRVLLLDEPSMGLAPVIVRQIFQIIREIRDEGVTVLLVEQNARQALAIADVGYVLDTGRIVLSGPAADLANDPRVQEAYLGGNASSSAGR